MARRPSQRPLASSAARTLAVLALAWVAACGAAKTQGGPLDPRFVAVHNTLSAMGMAQIGPVQEGTLAEGGEVRARLALPAGCFTIVTLGGQGIRAIDAALLDARGTSLAHEASRAPEAALHVCLDAADDYALVVRAASGSGSWLSATWAGADGGRSAGSRSASSAQEANGTCDAPIPLAAGVVQGSTTHGQHEYSGSCNPSDSREIVYELDLAARQHVVIEVEAHFDSVLYIRKDDCTDSAAEVDCNDDAPDRNHSKLDRVLEPGKYFVFVDGYSHDTGEYKLTVTTSDVLALVDVCAHPPELLEGIPENGGTRRGWDTGRGTCGGATEGAEVYRAQVATRSRVRIVEHADDVTPVVRVRRACADEDSEVACADSGAFPNDAAFTGVLEPGSYFVFADAHDPNGTGTYSLLLQTAPVDGAGTRAPGDRCVDAPLLQGTGGTVSGDTFAARDDLASRCGGQGAPDVVYRVDVPKTGLLSVSFELEEAPHVVSLRARCAERAAEIACGRQIAEVVAPGAYYVVVDGDGAQSFGRFTLHWSIRDLSSQAEACAAAPSLTEGRGVEGTTTGKADSFATTCVTDGTGGPDRVYRLVVPKRSKLRITAESSAMHPALGVRRACAERPGAPPADVACESASEGDGVNHATLERWFEPGTYWIVVDGQSPADDGPFRIEYHAVR